MAQGGPHLTQGTAPAGHCAWHTPGAILAASGQPVELRRSFLPALCACVWRPCVYLRARVWQGLGGLHAPGRMDGRTDRRTGQRAAWKAGRPGAAYTVAGAGASLGTSEPGMLLQGQQACHPCCSSHTGDPGHDRTVCPLVHSSALCVIDRLLGCASALDSIRASSGTGFSACFSACLGRRMCKHCVLVAGLEGAEVKCLSRIRCHACCVLGWCAAASGRPCFAGQLLLVQAPPSTDPHGRTKTQPCAGRGEVCWTDSCADPLAAPGQQVC